VQQKPDGSFPQNSWVDGRPIGNGLQMDQVKRMKDLELENQRLRRAVSDLTLDKLILAEAAKGNF
jgi:hypothetical protein